MGVSRRSIRIDISDVIDGLDKLEFDADIKIKNYLSNSCEELEYYMKENAPWNDRTGNARRGLNAKVEHPKDNYYRIALKHGVIYGKYLENAMEKRFAILEPTVRLKGPDVINGMKGLLNR